MAREKRSCRIVQIVRQYPRDAHGVPDRDANPLSKFVKLDIAGATSLVRLELTEIGFDALVGWALPVEGEFGSPHPGKQYQDKLTKVWITPTVFDFSGKVRLFLDEATEPEPAEVVRN